MKKLNKVAALFATAALAASASSAFAQAKTIDNWVDSSSNTVWKNGTNEYCWRNSYWTPATAFQDCDGALKPVVAPEPTPAPAAVAPVTPPPAPAPTPAPAPLAPASEKITFAADTFFDFDKSVLKPTGKAKLDELVQKVREINMEVVVSVGHTDSVGTDAYNQRLSIRRAEAVKSYLATKGIEKSRIYSEGKGEKQPVADNKTKEGRAKNRRVEIEVVGTRKQ
jgi:OmpA-OmpF porin, OOP family